MTSCGYCSTYGRLGRIKMAVVHPCDAVSLSAALDARAAGVIEPVLIGPRARIEAVAQKSDLKIDGIAIEDVPHSHAAAARAVELAVKGEVEALMKGSLHTDELMAAVVASPLRTKRRMSHCFLMQTPAYPRPFIITDAAVNIAPTLSEKADIVCNAVELAHAFGIARPRVAILAAVETINPNMPATLDAAALCKMADRGQIPGAILDGPLAFDNAVSAAAARTKGIVSEVAGAADILVVPDLESGNMLAKQLMYLGGAASAGIVVGARVPIVLTSRADPREARIASCAVALVAARRGATCAASARQQTPSAWRPALLPRPRRRGAAVMSAAAVAAGARPLPTLRCSTSSRSSYSTAARRASSSPCSTRRSQPLPRKPLWAGKVDGIGSASPSLVEADAAPVPLALDAEQPVPRRLAEVRACVEAQPADGCPRRWPTASCTAAASTPQPVRIDRDGARRTQEPHSARAAAPAVRARRRSRSCSPKLPRAAAGRVLRYRIPPHASAGRADAAVAARTVGARHPPLRVSRSVVRVHGHRTCGTTRRRRARPHDRRPSRQRRQPVRNAPAAKRGDHDGLLRARRPDDGHALRLDSTPACCCI